MNWYNATAAAVDQKSNQSTVFTQQAISSGVTNKIGVKVEEMTTDYAGKLMLTTKDAVSESDSSIALAAGDSAYYNGTADKAHMYKRNADADHRKAIAVKITLHAEDGFNATDGTYKVKISVSGIGRLGVALETCATDSAKYVGTNTDVIAEVTVSSGTFSDVVVYAYLSLSGTTGAQNDANLATSDWTFAVVNSGTANALTSAPSEPAVSGS